MGPLLGPAASASALAVVDLPPLHVPARYPGYQLATDAGDVLPFGAAARAAGPSGGLPFPVTAVARTESGAGSWTVTADGGVLTSGDARFYGSLGATAHSGRVVAIAPTASGAGYWLASSTGGVFAFGDAAFYGSLGGAALRAGVVSLVATPTGRGYWLASADGGVFTFGDAGFYGAPFGQPLTGWISAMTPTPSGHGYWLASVDGGVFTFGDAGFFGRPDPSQLHAPVAGIASSRSGLGYWVATADGGVFTFGDAPFLGSTGGRVWGHVVGIAAGTGRKVAKALQVAPARLRSAYGNDVSWPQCTTGLPGPGYGFGIVGITDGRPFSQNPCLTTEWAWATASGSGAGVYVNLAAASFGGAAEMRGPAGNCRVTDLPCQTYNQAANTIGDALAYADASGVRAPMWWLDVEVLNRWSPNQALNALTVKAAVETLAQHGIRAGIYSTPLMWRTLTGGTRMNVPVWFAGAANDAVAPAVCTDPRADFTGGGVWLVQSLPIVFDVNYACSPVLTSPASVFAVSP